MSSISSKAVFTKFRESSPGATRKYSHGAAGHRSRNGISRFRTVDHFLAGFLFACPDPQELRDLAATFCCVARVPLPPEKRNRAVSQVPFLFQNKVCKLLLHFSEVFTANESKETEELRRNIKHKRASEHTQTHTQHIYHECTHTHYPFQRVESLYRSDLTGKGSILYK